MNRLSACVLLLTAAATAPGQDAVKNNSNVAAALRWLEQNNAWIVQQQVELCQIPAPPFQEEKRAAEFRKRLETYGGRNARIDAEGNAIAEMPGSQPSPLVILSAHLDTVFPASTDVTVKKSGGRLLGPGISDDCRGLAVVLAVARAIHHHKIIPKGSLWIVGTVGEEGEGDLRGVRHLFGQGKKKEAMPKIDYFISVDGAGNNVTTGGVGSHRYRVVFKGPGGHSYGSFGMPNPTHAMGRAIARLSEIQVPATPRTTFNVGTVRGGTSVNSIAYEVSMDVDMRSESPKELELLVEKFRSAVQNALVDEQARWPASNVKLSYEIQTLGIRPAGQQEKDAAIVQKALLAAKSVGLEANLRAYGSTDSNIPIALGIPAVTIAGGGRSAGAHSLGEWYEDGNDGYRGPQWTLAFVLSLLGM